ncbi:hypothetical protein UY3_00436 [Chelonia mydas]|uniref:Uncharacterized protein n=1 Tax=Chelonia mydas TaxID=8469 RepID=M7BWR8_CHEMY|nr:hypothetical protein UY3_00436 [Chelonia mydas]
MGHTAVPCEDKEAEAGILEGKGNHRSGAVPKTCHFYKDLDAILRGNPTSTAKSPIATLAGLEAADSGLNHKDEVMDKEVEMEDDVEHVAGSSGGTASQDLFSTLEESSQSQQSSSGMHDAGEESSVYKVPQDSLPLLQIQTNTATPLIDDNENYSYSDEQISSSKD